MEAKDNEDILNKLSLLLEEADQAKQELRNKGYGWTGLSLLETVKRIILIATFYIFFYWLLKIEEKDEWSTRRNKSIDLGFRVSGQ